MNWALIITLSRFFFTPITIYLLFENELVTNKIASTLLAGFLYFIGSMSDLLDGYIARKYNQVSKLGEFLDPLADKFFTLGIFICFATISYIYVSWILVALICLREVTVTCIRIYALQKNMVMKTEMHGKVKTTIQIVVQSLIFIVLWHYQIIFEMDTFKTFMGEGSVNQLTVQGFEEYFYKNDVYPDYLYRLLYALPNILIGLTCFFTLKSGYYYIKSNWTLLTF